MSINLLCHKLILLLLFFKTRDCTKEVDEATVRSPIGLKTVTDSNSASQLWPCCFFKVSGRAGYKRQLVSLKVPVSKYIPQNGTLIHGS